jgi:hypothetical protein
VLPVLLAAYLAAHGAETALTMAARGADRASLVELNPALAPFVDRPAIYGAVSAGSAAALSGYLAHVHHTHPRLVMGIVVALVVLETGAAVHNAQQFRR